MMTENKIMQLMLARVRGYWRNVNGSKRVVEKKDLHRCQYSIPKSKKQSDFTKSIEKEKE